MILPIVFKKDFFSTLVVLMLSVSFIVLGALRLMREYDKSSSCIIIYSILYADIAYVVSKYNKIKGLAVLSKKERTDAVLLLHISYTLSIHSFKLFLLTQHRECINNYEKENL